LYDDFETMRDSLEDQMQETREAKRELEAQRDALEQSNEKLEQFAYVASHDLQEPLRMVNSYIDLLEVELADQLDDETREFMAFAVDGAQRMQAMIDGLLQFSRVQTKADPFAETDASTVVDETIQDLELKIDEADATVTQGNLPTVTADRNQLGQVFQNLVKNAIDHGGDGPTVDITATERDDATAFAVSDDGPGIPDHQRGDIFEISNTGTESEGTGIGLAVCREIVDRHGGDIWVESIDGEGTTFHFTIPDSPG
jgi:light-regulated signal transduction histidine kinase (bacteriophytochrome)